MLFRSGGQTGKRPDRATIVYCNLIRKKYKDVPIVIGGIEASLRRLAHYDYWSDRVRRSILLDSQADILSYGMGEHSIVEVAQALDAGIAARDITFVAGTVYRTKNIDSVCDAIQLPSWEEINADKKAFARSFYTQYCNTDPFSGKCLVEKYKDTEYIVQNPPAKPLSQSEMDRVYALHAQLSSVLRGGRRRAGNIGTALFHNKQSGMFWRVQFLCAHLPSGTHHPEKEPRVHFKGGGGFYLRAGF